MNLRTSLFKVSTLPILAATLFAGLSYAGPRINWTYHNTKNNHCEKVCIQRVLGACVQWREECNQRTLYTWNGSQKQVVQAAMDRLSDRITNQKVRTCTNQHTRFFQGNYAQSGQRQRVAWLDFDGLARANQWPKVNLQAWRSDETWTARAYIGRKAWGNGNGPLQWNAEIDMEINLARVDEFRSRVNFDHAANSYAGTIFHELLHQMGHDHPGTGDYSKDYEQGHFVVAAGDCIATNGETARNSGLSLRGHSWFIPR